MGNLKKIGSLRNALRNRSLEAKTRLIRVIDFGGGLRSKKSRVYELWKQFYEMTLKPYTDELIERARQITLALREEIWPLISTEQSCAVAIV